MNDIIMPWGREIPYTTPTGIKTTLRNIGYLAVQLGRTPQTVRRWEIGKCIPKTPFKDSRGQRLYAEEHIQAIVDCAERAGINQGRNMSQTQFSVWVYKEFDRIHKEFFDVKKEK